MDLELNTQPRSSSYFSQSNRPILPGMAIMKLSGYDTPAKPIITATSIASLAVACVGGITIVLASITAALCMGKDAHELKENDILQESPTEFLYFRRLICWQYCHAI